MQLPQYATYKPVQIDCLSVCIRVNAPWMHCLGVVLQKLVVIPQFVAFPLFPWPPGQPGVMTIAQRMPFCSVITGASPPFVADLQKLKDQFRDKLKILGSAPFQMSILTSTFTTSALTTSIITTREDVQFRIFANISRNFS